MRIIIISPAFPPDRDGVGDYTSAFADELSEKNEVIIVTSKSKDLISEGKNRFHVIRGIDKWGGLGLFHILSICKNFSPELVIIQYVPFMYGRGGINLTFPLLSILIRIRYRVFTMVHEPFISFGHSIKYFLISIVQRLMLFFLIIGSDRIGVSIKVWERMLKRIFFTGYCSSEDVSRYLSITDIFLLPLIDGISSRRTTLMTALKHGVPVVSTNGFLTDDIFLQENFTLLSPSTDKALFVANVVRMADDDTLRKNMGKRGKEAYEKYFSERLMIERYLDHAFKK